MSATEMIGIAHIGRKIAAMTGKAGPSHQQVYDIVLRGLVPATFERGRWYVSEEDVPQVAQALKIAIPAVANVAA